MPALVASEPNPKCTEERNFRIHVDVNLCLSDQTDLVTSVQRHHSSGIHVTNVSTAVHPFLKKTERDIVDLELAAVVESSRVQVDIVNLSVYIIQTCLMYYHLITFHGHVVCSVKIERSKL